MFEGVKEAFHSLPKPVQRVAEVAPAALVAVSVGACATNPAEQPTPKPTASVSPFNSPMPSETAFQSQIATATPSESMSTPTTNPTPTETATPALKALDSITDAPLPETPVTSQNFRDAMTPVINYYTQHPELVDTRVGTPLSTIVTQLTEQCVTASDALERLGNCEGLLGRTWTAYQKTSMDDFYAAVRTGFNYAVGPNGIPNNPGLPNVRRDIINYLTAY
jgi:hypothetical protein